MKLGAIYPEANLLQDLTNPRQQDAAIRHLYREHYNKVLVYIRQNGGSDQDAEDLFQEAIVSFIQILGAGRFRGECSSGTFLYSLVRHAWLNEFKRNRRAKLREEKFGRGLDTIELDISQQLVTEEFRRELDAMLAQLGETCRTILKAFYYEGESMREILERLDFENEQVVRNKKVKCLKQLAGIMSAQPNWWSQFKSML